MNLTDYSIYLDPMYPTRYLIYITVTIVNLCIIEALENKKPMLKIKQTITVFGFKIATFTITAILTILSSLIMPRYGTLIVRYIEPSTDTTITRANLIDNLCIAIENNQIKRSTFSTKPDAKSYTVNLDKAEYAKIQNAEGVSSRNTLKIRIR